MFFFFFGRLVVCECVVLRSLVSKIVKTSVLVEAFPGVGCAETRLGTDGQGQGRARRINVNKRLHSLPATSLLRYQARHVRDCVHAA